MSALHSRAASEVVESLTAANDPKRTLRALVLWRRSHRSMMPNKSATSVPANSLRCACCQASVSSAFDTCKPALIIERQDSAHTSLNINPGISVLHLRLTAFLQHLVHYGAILSASCMNQIRAASYGSIGSHRLHRDKSKDQTGHSHLEDPGFCRVFLWR